MSYAQMMRTPTERWLLIMAVSVLLHLLIIFGINIQPAVPIPHKPMNKPITLIIEKAPLSVAEQKTATPDISVQPTSVINKKTPDRVIAKASTPVQKSVEKQHYIKAPPVKKQLTQAPKRLKTVPKIAKTAEPVLPVIGIPVQAVQTTVQSSIPDNLNNVPSIGIPVIATSAMTPGLPPKPTVVKKEPTLPAPVQTVQPDVVKVEAVQIKQTLNNEKLLPEKTALETIQPNVTKVETVSPRQTQTNSPERSTIEEIVLETLQANTVQVETVHAILSYVIQSLKAIAPVTEITPKTIDTVPEQFMTSDLENASKQVIQENTAKQLAQAEQQKRLGKIEFREQKDYGDVEEQASNIPKAKAEKSKGLDFGIHIGDCFLGYKGTDKDLEKSDKQRKSSIPIDCDF